MESVVRTARTVEEAEELALKELGVDRSEVEVEILSRGKSGFLGLGAELARVRVVRITETASEGATVSEGETASDGDSGNPAVASAAPPAVSPGSAGTVAMETVNRILTTAGVNVVSTLRSANDPDVGGPVIDLSGEDSGLLIGRRGQTLQSLQLLVNMITRKEIGDDVRVALDVEHYRQRREASLRDMASKVAARVVQTGHSITLEPMTAADRRVVHVSLSDHQGVRTESIGFGDDRKVSIIATSDDRA